MERFSNGEDPYPSSESTTLSSNMNDEFHHEFNKRNPSFK